MVSIWLVMVMPKKKKQLSTDITQSNQGFGIFHYNSCISLVSFINQCMKIQSDISRAKGTKRYKTMKTRESELRYKENH